MCNSYAPAFAAIQGHRAAEKSRAGQNQAGHDGLEQGWSIEKQHGKRIRRYAGMIPSAGLNYCSVIFPICQVKSGNPAKKRRNLPLPVVFTAGNVRFFPFPP